MSFVLNIEFTFDYELFFRQNKKSYDEILFDSTNSIMDILDKHNIKATFFVDTLSYQKMMEIGDTHYCSKMKEQCIDMLKRGHNPQLHIHAHWISSEYDKERNVWSNDYKKYRIQDYPNEEINAALDNGISFLNDCAEKAQVDYRCNTFRAGGLILQPEKELIPMLLDKGIKFDSSIAPNAYSKNAYAEYDYRKCPKKLNWYISQEKGCCVECEKKENSLFEIPVATVRNSFFRYMFLKRPIRISNTYPGGIGFLRPHQKNSFFTTVKRRLFGYSWVSLDTRHANVIMSDLNHIYKKYKCDSNHTRIALIGHPKMFDKRNEENLDLLITLLKKNNKYICREV